MTDDVVNDVTTPSEISVTSSRSSLKLPSNHGNPLSRTGSYREKLPKLSPKLQKNFLGSDLPNNEDLNDSSSSDSGCPHPVVNGNHVNGVVGVNGDLKVDEEKNDIEFFVQVVGVFREYIADQIAVLEDKLVRCQGDYKNVQNIVNQNEQSSIEDEGRLSADISRLSGFLFNRQSKLKDDIKRQHEDEQNKARNALNIVKCSLKQVSGTLSFARNLRQHSSENMKEQAVRELKNRLMEIRQLEQDSTNALKDVKVLSRTLDTTQLEKLIKEIDFTNNTARQTEHIEKITIEASKTLSDVTKSSILVRWVGGNCEEDFVVHWSFEQQNRIVNMSKQVLGSCELISNLPSNCDVTVQIEQENFWSEAAFFTTKPAPQVFVFDAASAHSKLELSDDSATVRFGGEKNATKGTSPHSSTRFSFALNVLGNVAFRFGRHYFEVGVNDDGWAVGVAYYDVARNSWLGSNKSSWILHYNGSSNYKVRHAGESTDVSPKYKNKNNICCLKTVGIYINYERGFISFVDPNQQQTLHICQVKHGFHRAVCAAVNPFYHGKKLTLNTGLDVPDFVKR